VNHARVKEQVVKTMPSNSTILLCLCFCLLMASVTWPAVYYVSKDGGDHEAGSNTAPYDTWANAALNPATVVNYIEIQPDASDIIYIDGDIFTGDCRMWFDHPNHSDTIVNGAGTSRTVIYGGNHPVYGVTADRVTIKDLTLVAAGAQRAIYQDGCDAWTFENVDCIPAIGHANHIVYLLGGNTVFKSCRVFHSFDRETSFNVWCTGDSTAIFQNCIFAPAPHAAGMGNFQASGTGTIDIYNCLFSGAHGTAIIVDGPSVNLTNTIIAGVGTFTTSGVAVARSSGSVNIQSCYLMGNTWDGDAEPTSGAIEMDVANIRSNMDLQFSGNARVGYILPCVDDDTNFGYAQEVASILAIYGMSGTYFVSQSEWKEANTASLRQMVSDGVMEVGAHGYSHTSLSYTHALRFSYTGRDTNPTVAMTPGRMIQMRTNEGNDNLDIDTTDMGYDTIGEIVAVHSHNWTIIKSPTGGQLDSLQRDACRASSMAAQEATPAPCDIDFDTSGYSAGLFRDEILEPKTWMADMLINGDGDIRDPQTGMTYVCRTFAAPFGRQSGASQQAAMNAGYLMSRSNDPNGRNYRYLVDVNMFAVKFSSASDFVGADETATRKNARALAYGAIAGGIVIPFLAHNTTEMTLEQWVWCLDEWSKFGDSLVVTSCQVFADTVHDSGLWTNNGDGTYSRTYESYTDYHLGSGSPCVDSGIDLGDDFALDYDGLNQNHYGSGWEIGPYVYPLARNSSQR